MIDPTKLTAIQTVYYHGSCPDGITAREVLKYALKGVKFVPYYFTELKFIPKKALFIDCSPKDEQLEECLKSGCLVAEHHESFVEGYNRLNDIYPGQMTLGDNSKAESGATLALHIVEILRGGSHWNQGILNLVRLISISDTWKKDDPDFALARMFAGYIAFFGNDFCESLGDLAKKEDVVRAFGAVQTRRQEVLAKGAVRTEENGFKVAFINDLNMSNAAELLRTQEGTDLVVGYIVKFDDRLNQNIVIYSLRSQEDGFDVSKFAKANGGGGHKAAAGFSIPYLFGVDPIANFLSERLNAR